jgi:hypothetical protein
MGVVVPLGLSSPISEMVVALAKSLGSMVVELRDGPAVLLLPVSLLAPPAIALLKRRKLGSVWADKPKDRL